MAGYFSFLRDFGARIVRSVSRMTSSPEAMEVKELQKLSDLLQDKINKLQSIKQQQDKLTAAGVTRADLQRLTAELRQLQNDVVANEQQVAMQSMVVSSLMEDLAVWKHVSKEVEDEAKKIGKKQAAVAARRAGVDALA